MLAEAVRVSGQRDLNQPGGEDCGEGLCDGEVVLCLTVIGPEAGLDGPLGRVPPGSFASSVSAMVSQFGSGACRSGSKARRTAIAWGNVTRAWLARRRTRSRFIVTCFLATGGGLGRPPIVRLPHRRITARRSAGGSQRVFR